MNGNRRTRERRLILFTWTKCVNCHKLMDQISNLINSRVIEDFDLEDIQANKQLWNLFQVVSPNNNIPALAVIENGRLVAKAVGKDNILDLLEEIL